MKVYFHEEFYTPYTSDPAAKPGRMESIMEIISPHVKIYSFEPASENDICAVHPKSHVQGVYRQGLYDIAALAAGGAISAANTGMQEPSFALIRPPGHHASVNSCWGFCFFNNMAISLYHLRLNHLIETAFVLDFDLHYGDGNVDILGEKPWVEILNPKAADRGSYLDRVKQKLDETSADVIAVSAGFDSHFQDWGGVLTTEDYYTIGRWVYEVSQRNSGGCYGMLEGGYNHDILGENVLAFLKGLDGGQ
ncbi:MAG: histone deacetylase family protein [Desulfobacteraceae bacterium]|jgi:acetoin utilization deacetylase AcuC-like enzyme